MDNAIYVGLSKQMILRKEMDIIANNIANMDTTGFKVESMIQKTDPKAPAYTFGGPRPVKFVSPDGVARDFTQGAMNQTGNPLDMAIEGKGMFQVRTADGARFTRDGRFTLDNAGRLVTQTGNVVLDEGGGEIQIDPERGQLSVGADGTLSQGAERVGKIGVFEFTSLGVLEKTGDNLLRNGSNQQPTPATEAKVRQGYVEASNVKPVIEISRMMEVSRSYERTVKMIDSEADLSRRAVERLGKLQ
jgi:flagellar basal-body rod protein FlgF